MMTFSQKCSVLIFFNLMYTVPLKGKLTVSTGNFILEPWSFRELRIEFWFSRIENRVSRIEFRDTRIIFWGPRTEISRKRFNSRKQTISMNKTIDAQLCSPKPALKCMQIFFRVVHILKGMRLGIYTEASHIPAIRIYSFTCWSEWVFFSLRDYNPEGGCCFHLRDFNWPQKRKQMA